MVNEPRPQPKWVRFLTVCAVLFGIGYMTYTYFLPKQFVLPEHGISFKLPSPALISWRSLDVPDLTYQRTFFIRQWVWNTEDDSSPQYITISDATCLQAETEIDCDHEEALNAEFQQVIGRVSYKEPTIVYTTRLDDGTVFNSVEEGCMTDSCAYQWNKEDDVVYVRFDTEIVTVPHPTCDVAYQTVIVAKSIVPFWHTLVSAKCGTKHVLIDSIALSGKIVVDIERMIDSIIVLE